MSTRLPGQPAAVLVYGPDGAARCVSLDFDVSRGGLAQVEADVERLITLLGRCGAGWFADRSPSGGRHVYVPLAVPVGFVQVRQVALALRLLLPSLDVSPLVNLTSGCIRPPGARHRTGGWQSLDGSLTAAARLAGRPNGPQVWTALLEQLAPQLHTLALDDLHPHPPCDLSQDAVGDVPAALQRAAGPSAPGGGPTTGARGAAGGAVVWSAVLPVGAAGGAGPKERAAYAAGTAFSSPAAVSMAPAAAATATTAAAGAPLVSAATHNGCGGAVSGDRSGRETPGLSSARVADAAVPVAAPVGGVRRGLRAAVVQVARTGVFDQARYRSPSEARQAVLASAAASGWSWADVTGELEAGRWPGLWGFYARYAPRHRREALAGDWLAALAYARQLPPPSGSSHRTTSPASPGSGPAGSPFSRAAGRSATGGAAQPLQSHVHNPDTREPPTHRARPLPGFDLTGSRTPTAAAASAARPRSSGVAGAAAVADLAVGGGRTRVLGVDGEFGFVRSWWSAVLLGERDRYRGRGGHSARLVLRALGAAAQKTGRRHVAFGVRSLSLACGASPSTVADVLVRLRQETDPFVLLVEAGRGLQGDLYELRLPAAYEEQALSLAWRPGKITALLPVFRRLGVPAAFVYEALDAAAHSSWDLAAVALLSPRAAQQALAELAAHGLAVRDRDGWRRGPADPTAVARSLGVLEELQELLERYRAHRHTWRQRLLAGGLLTVATVLAATRPPRPHPPQPNQLTDPEQSWLTRQPQPPPAPHRHRSPAAAGRPPAPTASPTDTRPDTLGSTWPPDGQRQAVPFAGTVSDVPGEVLELLRLELGAVVLA